MGNLLWTYWMWFSAIIGFFWMLILIPLSYFIVTRPFDKLVPRGVGPEYDLWFVSVLFARPIVFIIQILLPNYARNALTIANWGDFIFRDHASRRQIIFSYLYMGCLLYMFLIYAPIKLIHDYVLNG
ncbi:hypothetical protein JYT31_03270 [Beggiatoa alba]|nr:hypothetical protein [Beggiatoa alba]